jgi:hypothetical protein
MGKKTALFLVFPRFKAGLAAGEGYYAIPALFLFCGSIMKTVKEDSQRVDDTNENLEMCICKLCPTFRENRLSDYPPGALFCARGRSRIPVQAKMTKCYCLGCDVFINHGLVIDRLCVNR